MNRKTAFIAACLLWLAAPAAQAQSDMNLRMDSGFYIGAGVGRMEQRDFCANIVGGTCDSKDLTWNLFAGYQVNRHFAVEGGYVDFGKATVSGFLVANGAPAAVISDTTALELVAVGIVPLNASFSLYGKLGLFRWDSDGNFTGGFVATASDTGTELTFGLGAEYTFYRNFSARFEWQRYLEVGNGLNGIPKGDISLLRFATRYRF